MKILITGSSGTIASAFVPQILPIATSVVCQTRVGNSLAHFSGTSKNLEIVEVGLNNSSLISDLLDKYEIDTIVHTAAAKKGSEQELWLANVTNTCTLLSGIQKSRAKPHLIHISSSAVYAPSTEGKHHALNEGWHLAPILPYGASKLASEALVRQYQDISNLTATILRPFNVVASSQGDEVVNGKVARQLARLELGLSAPRLELGYLGSCRDFVDVRDVADAIVRVIVHNICGETLNICSGVARPMRDVISKLKRHSFASERLAISDLAMPSDTDVQWQSGNFDKLNRLTNWSPTITLDRSLLDNLNYWRANRRGLI